MVCEFFFPFFEHLFTPWIVSFAVKKSFCIWYSPICLVLVFFAYALGVLSKTTPMLRFWSVSPTLPPSSISVTSLKFRSLVHPELISVYDEQYGSNLILLCICIQFCQNDMLKRLFLSHCKVWVLCWKSVGNVYIRLIWGLSCFIDLCGGYYASTILF